MSCEIKSKVLRAVYETARDLHGRGYISDAKMKKYDSMCLAPHGAAPSASARPPAEKKNQRRRG